ncbi:MAG: radical SAM family heme chaperone HemW [Deltaproteobacteria bacterium]|nr:radical SAM family heme chaperone HemW [Deltaproteobacteria bacterium]
MREPSKKPPRRSVLNSLYIHFPYCLYKCHYCDFNSYAVEKKSIPFEEYQRVLLAEWEKRLPLLDSARPIRTVFFGGGTPSLMRPSDLADLLRRIQKSVPLCDDVEVTLEANPKTISAKKLDGFKRAGINRLSIGVQSLHDAYLSAFGRIHSADDAREALKLIATAGFRSWNADLIFGFPGQTLKQWESDLNGILDFDPPHLSCYSFTVEEGTIYHQQIKSGKALPPDSDLQAEMFEMTGKILARGGLRRYEISNFARPGHECRHNLNYWNYGEYLGLGAGAVSFLRSREKSGGFGYRSTNFKEPNRYMNVLKDSQIWFDREEIPFGTAMGEFMMMGLRLDKGVSVKNFEELFGESYAHRFAGRIAPFENRGWMTGGTRLTGEGRLFSNQIMAAFLPSPA